MLMTKRALQWLALFVLLKSASARCDDPENFVDDVCLCSDGQGEAEKSKTTCSTWCTESYVENAVTAEILDQSKGLVSFSFKPSPSWCDHICYTIELYVENKTSEHRNLRHSIRYVHLSNNCSSDCSKVVKVNYEFVFSGVYWLSIQPKTLLGTGQSCKSKKFNFTTYSFQPPSEKPLSLSDSFDRNFGIHADFNGVFDIENPQTVHLILTADASSGSNDACVASGKQTVCSMDTEPSYIESNKQNSCECSWHMKSLRCDFFNVTPGHYCIEIKVDDQRCDKNTLWGAYYKTCNWHFNATYQHAITPPHDDSDGYIPIIITAVIITVALLVMVAIFIEKKYCKRKPILKYPTYIVVPPPQPRNPQKVLLVYPRDCKPFMDVMNNLRQFLKMTPDIEVFDIWDEESFEIMAQYGVKHVSLLLAEDVKIILMATPLSRKYQNWNKLEYVESEPFDNIFPMIFDHIYSMEDMYKKVLVVRLNGPDFKENVFEFVSNRRVYTIPLHCDALIASIFGLNPGLTHIEHGQESECLDKLSNSITEYNNYRSRCPDYLNKLLRVYPQNGL